MDYQQLISNPGNMNQSYDSNYYVCYQPFGTSNSISDVYTTQNPNYSATFTNYPTQEVDLTIKQEINFAHNTSVILFGVLSGSFVTLVFLFSYLWFSIDMDYPNLTILVSICCLTMCIIIFIFIPLFYFMNKKYKRLQESVFEQNNRIFL